MTITENHELLLLAKKGRAESVTVELNEGTYRMTSSEALTTFDRLYPGEPFQVISINYTPES